ncbi:DUF1302 domain-containing protein, partial [Aromatoleum diolicum]
METRRQGGVFARRQTAVAVAVALLSLSSGVQAFEIDTGNADLQVRWDNTVRYNLATRVESRDRKIGNSALTDEGTYSFDRGDLVANRLDLLSELDVVYKGTTGFRVSGAAWYDAAYGDNSESNPNAPFAAIPSYTDHEYSRYTKRYYAGPSGEVLDAFVFANFDAASVPVRL